MAKATRTTKSTSRKAVTVHMTREHFDALAAKYGYGAKSADALWDASPLSPADLANLSDADATSVIQNMAANIGNDAAVQSLISSLGGDGFDDGDDSNDAGDSASV